MRTAIIARIGAIVALAGMLAACSSAPQSTPPVRFIAANAAHRTFSDFLAAQGTYCIPESTGVPAGGAIVDGCVLYVPYAPNFIGFAVATPAPYCADYTVAAVDYTGLANRYIVEHGGTSLGTTVSGTVNEKRMPDGSGVVDVVISTHNALSWGGCDHTKTLNFATSTVLFGNRPDDVLHGAPAALADSVFRATYTEAHYGGVHFRTSFS